jgi:nucleoside-triphosphatase THEP1
MATLPRKSQLILWTGQKHSGKTTAAGKLVERARGEGFRVAGLLAPSVYKARLLVGFDGVDLSNGETTKLARMNKSQGGGRRISFTEAGLRLGKAALGLPATGKADLVVVDEFGPLELDNKGWRKDVDLLLTSTKALLLLVVRRELVERVRMLYGLYPSRKLAATKKESVEEVIRILRERRTLNGQNGQA